MLNRHVYIIGMPGSGKSSLGRRVASNLGLPFIDTDQRIEQSVGCSTSDTVEVFVGALGEDALVERMNALAEA